MIVNRQLLDAAPVPTISAEFDYQQLASAMRRTVQDQTQAIRGLVATTAKSVVQIGLRLEYVHDHLGREQFQRWLACEFGWSQATASKFMCIARAFRDADSIERFDPTALYLLARRKVSDAARAKALELAKCGETITKSRALEIIEQTEQGTITAEKGRAAQRVRRYVERTIQSLPSHEAEVIVSELREFLSHWEREVRLDGDSDEP